MRKEKQRNKWKKCVLAFMSVIVMVITGLPGEMFAPIEAMAASDIQCTYLYDCSRNPAYPQKDGTVDLHSFYNPLIMKDEIDEIDGTKTGFSFKYINTYENVSSEIKEKLSLPVINMGYEDITNIDNLEVYQLQKEGTSYAYAFRIARLDNGHLFVGEHDLGYFFSNTQYNNSDSVTPTVTGDTSDMGSDEPSGSHTHSWSTDWAKNDTHHWYECTDTESCDGSKGNYEEHVYEDAYDTTCDICNYQKNGTPPDPPTTGSITGNLDKESEIAQGAPETTISTSVEELMSSDILSDGEKTLVNGGVSAKIWIKVAPLDEQTVPSEDKTKAEEKAGSGANITYLDLTMWKQIGSNAAEKITNVNKKIEITIDVPEALKNTDTNKTRIYNIIRVHNGEASVLEGTYYSTTGKFTFVTDAFSTYAIVYKDQDKETNPSDNNNSSNNDDSSNPVTKPENNGDRELDQVPKTGDDSRTMMWFMVMLVSGMGASLLLRRKKETE